MRRKPSILQDKPVCIVCGATEAEIHHVFFGNPSREHCDEDGLWVWACPYHHRLSAKSFHFCKAMDDNLKEYAQKTYEMTHTRDEFINRYGRSYL